MPKASEAREGLFREIFDHVATGIAVYEAVDEGADFIFKDINPAAALIGKIPREAHLGQRVTEVYPGVKEMGLLEVFRTVWRTGVPQRHPVSLYKDDRLELWAENYVARLPTGEILAVYDDQTARKKAELEKAELIRHIHRIQKMEALATLAAGIAHDFNNLLMPILGYAQMGLDQSPPDRPVARYFQRILDASRRAKELVSQILLLSRENVPAEAGTDFVPIMKECVKLLRAGIPKTVNIAYETLPETAPVRADPAELHQILMNLTVNAFHAVKGKAGTVRLMLECPSQDQRILRHAPPTGDAWVRFSVMDNGPGVPEDLREKIFDPYFTTKGPEEGTGLGLFIVSGVVRRLGGAVWVEDAPGGGAAFHVLLPAATTVAQSGDAAACDLSRPLDVHVLTVDDDPDVRSILKAYLAPCISRLTLCELPEKALALFRQNPSDVDLVITDYSMPSMTGFDVAKSMKALRPHLPVVLLTGYRSVEDLGEEEIGLVDRVLYKPVTRGELIRVLQETLSRR